MSRRSGYAVQQPWGRRVAHTLLIHTVRGRREQGSQWGEALLGEFEETTGTWEAMRWTISGLPVAWRERRRRLATNRSAVRPSPLRAHPLRRALVAFAFLGVASVLANWLVATIAYIPSISMAPTLRVSDRVLIDKLTYRLAGVHYGDIVLVSFRLPGTATAPDTFVKRVIGLPGDTIACPTDHLSRNGTVLDESYLAPGATTRCDPVTVPQGTLYLLGDDRDLSMDSRQLGPIPTSDVIGRVVTRVWPLSRLGA